MTSVFVWAARGWPLYMECEYNCCRTSEVIIASGRREVNTSDVSILKQVMKRPSTASEMWDDWHFVNAKAVT